MSKEHWSVVKVRSENWVFVVVCFKLTDTCPFLAPLVPLFWISGDVSSGFQIQSGFCLIRFFGELFTFKI